MVKSGLASPLFLCKYPQENITIQRVVAKQADTLQQTARIRLAAGKGICRKSVFADHTEAWI